MKDNIVIIIVLTSIIFASIFSIAYDVNLIIAFLPSVLLVLILYAILIIIKWIWELIIWIVEKIFGKNDTVKIVEEKEKIKLTKVQSKNDISKRNVNQEKKVESVEVQSQGSIIENNVNQEEKIEIVEQTENEAMSEKKRDNIAEHINKEQSSEESFSFQRYIVNVIVRFAFFIPLGFSIAVIGLIVGSILDILLPRRYVIGGKIVAKTFNIGTLSWFEGVKFSVSVDVGASGKGISVKDERE